MEGDILKEFEVRFPKNDLLETGAIYLAFAVLCVLMFVSGRHFEFNVVFAVIVTVMFGMTVLPTCLFYLRVSDDVFKVRTKFGKKYGFDIKDIKKIECSNHNRPKLGPLYEMIIYTDSNELELNHGMEGFDVLAGYLLAKYENVELGNNSVSKDSYEMMLKITQMKNMLYFRK